MAISDKEHRFFLYFDSAKAFDRAFERKGQDTGYFFKTTRLLSVGKIVSIVVSVKDSKNQIFLEGRITIRRVRSGGPRLPQGVFVALTTRERARLDGIVSYLKSGRTREERVDTRFPITLRATYHTSEGSFTSETRNLSKGGAYLRCFGPLFTIGTRFPLDIHVQEVNVKNIALDAQVAWIDYFEDSKGMGVAFVKGQTQLKTIRRFLGKCKREMKQSID
ncbi:MAG: PilZ domain-containing protein [Deltaproteobacteria bacterium]|nr:PilZ domain-containing protein [Deltaproteobacteria bacterium]